MLLLYLFSQTCWWKSVLHKDEDSLLSTELDSLPNNVDELPNCKISREPGTLLLAAAAPSAARRGLSIPAAA